MFNQSSTASPFGGSGGSGSLFGASTPSTSFGNNTNSSFGGFGQNQNQNQNQSQNQNQGTSMFGNTGNNSFGSQTGQQTSMFGGGSSFGQAQKPSLFSNTNSSFGSPNQQSSLFSNPTQVASPQQSPDQSLFQKRSLFSVSSSDADAAKFREMQNQLQPQQQQQLQPQQQQVPMLSLSQSQNLGFASPVSRAGSSSPAPLRHSQSSYALGYRGRSNTPSWAAPSDKRFTPSTPSNLRHVSSFNTAAGDRSTNNPTATPSSVRRKPSISPIQSPTTSFGTSFSGVSKPSHQLKKKTVIQEDPPPARSIYDGASPSLSRSESVGVGLTSSPLPRRANTSLAAASTTTTPTKSGANGRPSSPRGSPGHGTSEYSNQVVIYGFPPSATPAVVAHFARFGTIAENVDVTASRLRVLSGTSGSASSAGSSPIRKGQPSTPIVTGPNWLKLTYDNPGSAARAVRDSGKFIAGNIVGCMLVTPQNSKEFDVDGLQPGGGLDEDRSFFSNVGDESIAVDASVDFSRVLEEDDAEEETRIKPKEGAPSTPAAASPAGGFGRGGVPRTVSLPALAGSKRVQLKDGRSILNKKSASGASPLKQMRYSPSLFKIAQEPDTKQPQSPNPGTSSANGTAAGAATAPGTPNGDGKRLQSGRLGWMSWTTKKAQELVFGWDDL